ncbi:nonribosomal peptide synthetase [Pseudomassariella vexata]|uniref:Nonribosomal peptide synthetase n=1 Tax=Pseudomassariella vexata TaxID=1141098 RepID=A0A1Y2EFP8_9PEZI|nr:nonribosomal peptide synthetase [Pseudomassariella vexata]ORY70408.1 nonribosomal peptide synthetase [Pseudomassariella vexata]
MTATGTASLGDANRGKRLIPHVIDENARKTPDREFIQIPRSSNPKDGWRIVAWKDYANAINRCAHKIVEYCGEATPGTFPTIAYIGPNDVRYLVVVVAAVKAGYKALFISPRNSQEGQINLFEMSDCHVLAFSPTHRAMVQSWLEERDMKAIEVSSMDSWFPAEEVPEFSYNKTWEQAEHDPFAVLHTSGSTGLPKPIVAKAGMLAISDACYNLREWNGTQTLHKGWAEKSKRHFVPMPLFHAAALYTIILKSIFWEIPVCLGIADRPLSSDLVMESLNQLDVESAVLPPATVEDMSQSEEYIKALAKLNCVIFGGGNLVREAGNRLVKNGVVLVNSIGSTEFAPFQVYWQPDPELWQYFIFNDDLFGCEWHKVEDDDEVYELHVVRQAKEPGMQGFFYTFPDADEYNTKDLYKPHPTLPNHWLYYSRSDDIIVFSNGEKLNPVTIEEIVSDHAEVKAALVVGSQRFQPGLLIEPLTPPKDAEEEKKLIDRIWPLVVQANKETVAHGRISRDLIAVSNPDKPFHRAGKGTIQRAMSIKAYAEEIDLLYEKANLVSHSDAPRLDISSEEALVESIAKMFEDHLGSPHLESDTEFFAAGIDSMQVINASRLLRAGIAAFGQDNVDSQTLATRVIYGNPTPRRLARYILDSVLYGGLKHKANEDEEQQHAMQFLYEKYTQNLLPNKKGRPNPSDVGQTVVLTGSTGMLGSYLLDQMAHNPLVKKVICLNRAADGGVKQQAKAMVGRGLDPSYQGKAEFYHTDLSRSNFGLPRDVYARLLKEADRVVHNAWPVNFNITVETFEPHLCGVRNLADFAAKAEKRVAVVFISSTGTADRWDSTTRGPVPEERLDDVSIPSGGYGRSKMVGSLIMEDAAKVGDFPAAIIRVGQIAGPEREEGAWNRQEWLPSIVASSLYMKALPSNLGAMDRVDWTPAERIASLVLEILGVAQKVDPEDITGYYHGVNPSVTSWKELAPAVQEFYGEDRIKEFVSFREWVNRLEKSQADGIQSVDANAGVKLLDFYKLLAEDQEAGHHGMQFDMRNTVKRSVTMARSGVVTKDMMKRWCKQWGFQ